MTNRPALRSHASRPDTSIFGKRPAWQRLILLGAIVPASMAIAPAARAADVILAPSFTINSDTGSPVYTEGLLEGFTDISDDENTVNPANSSPELGLRMAQIAGANSPASGQGAGSGPDLWANTRTWIYTGQINTGPNGILSFAFNNDDTDWLKINGNVVLNDNAWDTAAAGVVSGLAPNTWVDFEYRVSDTGGGGSGPSGQNVNGAANWNNTVGAVMSWNNLNSSLDANAYIGGANNLGKPTEVADGTATLFRYQSGLGFQDNLRLTASATVTLNGVNPSVAEPTLSFESASATLTVNDGTTDGQPASPIVHKTLSITQGTSFTANNQAVIVNGTSDLKVGKISDGAFTGNTLTAAGTGQLIFDYVSSTAPSDLSGTTLQAGAGGQAIVRGSGGLNPVASTTAPLTISGAGGKLDIGSSDLATIYDNAIAANESGTLAHTVGFADTIGSASKGVTIAGGKTLTVDVTNGSLTLAGNVSGTAGAVLNKTGANSLTINGTTNVPAVTANGGNLTFGGAATIADTTVNSGVVTFKGATTLTGATTIAGGTMILASPTGTSATNPIAVSFGGNLQVSPGTFTNGTANLSGGTLTLTGGNGAGAVSGFGGDGTGYAINFNNTAGATAPTVTSDVLRLTQPVNGYAGSAFNTTKQDVTKFISSFTYQQFGDNNGSLTNVADGAAFVIQNMGTNALGGGGGGLGYNGITNSAGFLLDIWSGARGGVGQQFSTGGRTPGNNADFPAFAPMGGINPQSGHPINITLTYDGNNVGVLMVDATTGARFETSYAADIQSAVGAGTAFVGFTAANGGLNADQRVSNFTYKIATPSENFGTNVNVAAGSASSIANTAITNKSLLGALTMGAGSTLNVSGATNTVFATTNFAARNGTYEISVAQSELSLGAFSFTGASGAPTLTKSGAGTLVLEDVGTSALPAGTTLNLNGGRLSVLAASTSPSPLGTSTTINMQGGGIDLSSKSGDLTFGGTLNILGDGIVSAGAASGATANPVIVTVGSNLAVGAGKTLTLSAAKSHTLSLTGTASGAGTAAISGGNVIANATALQGLGVSLTPTTGSANLNITGSTTISSLASSGAGTSTLVLGNGTGSTVLTINQNTDTVYAGAINPKTGGTASLVKNGTGTLALTGTNTTTGGLTVNAGTVDLGSGLSAGTGAINLSGGNLRVAPSGLQVLHYDTDAGAQTAFGNINTGYQAYLSYFAGLGANTLVNGVTPRTTGGGTTNLSFHDSVAAAPFGSVGIADQDNMAVRLTGTFYVPVEGDYGFRTGSDDGSVLFVDGSKRVDNNRYQGVQIRGTDQTTPNPGDLVNNPELTQAPAIHLTAGTHTIDIGFYEGGGGAAIDVYFSPLNTGIYSLIPNSILGGFHGANPVNVTANANIDLQGGTSEFGALTMTAGTTLSTTAGNISFAGATLPTAGTYGLNVDTGSMVLNGIIDGSTTNAARAVTINKSGAGTLVMNNTQTLQLQNTSSVLNVTAGAIAAVLDQSPNSPLGKAQINLNGGNLFVSSKGDGNGNPLAVTLTNTFNVNQDATIAAGNFGGGAVNNDTVNLQSLAIADGRTINLRSQNGYTLNVSNAISSVNATTPTSTLAITGGNVSAGTTTKVGTLNVTGGTFTARGDINARLGTNVADGATLALSNAFGPVAYTGGALNVNGGTIRADSGTVANLSAADLVFAPQVSAPTLNALQGRHLLTGGEFVPGLNPANTAAGITAAINTTPTASALLTGALDFAPADANGNGQGNGDGPLGTLFGAATNQRFNATFFGNFKAPSTGVYSFQVGITDDTGGFWVDLNQNGVFEQNGSAGNELISGNGCCGDGPVGTVQLTAGQSYKVAVGVEDTGGGSSLRGLFRTPTDAAMLIVNPSDFAQSGYWSTATTTGGGKLEIASAAQITARSLTNASDINLAGDGAQLTLNSATATTSSASVLRTSNLFFGQTATLSTGANNSLNVDHLTVANDGVLVKAGAGTLTAANQSLGANSTLRIDGGMVVLNGSANVASAGFGGNSGSVAINNTGVLQVVGGISGAVTINQGGKLTGTGTVGIVNATGGTIAPGINGAGALHAGDTTLNTGATLEMQIFGLGQYDQLYVSGSISLLSNIALVLQLNTDPADDGSAVFKLIDNDGTDTVNTTNGFFTYNGNVLANNSPFVVGTQAFRINYAGGDGNDVVLTAIPEPAAVMSMLGGLATLMGMQRFRRRRA